MPTNQATMLLYALLAFISIPLVMFALAIIVRMLPLILAIVAALWLFQAIR